MERSNLQAEINILYKEIASQKLKFERELEILKRDEEYWEEQNAKINQLKKELREQGELLEEKDWKVRELQLLLRGLENKFQEDNSRSQAESARETARRERENENLLQKEARIKVLETEASNYKSLSEKLASVIEDNYRAIQELRDAKKQLQLDLKSKENNIIYLIEGHSRNADEDQWLEYVKNFKNEGSQLMEIKAFNNSEAVLKSRKSEEKIRIKNKENEDHCVCKEKYTLLEQSYHILETELARLKVGMRNTYLYFFGYYIEI